MKTPNDNLIAPDTLGPEDEDQELRALISVDLEHDDDAPPCQPVDEFSDEFLLQAPRCRRADDKAE